MVGAYRIYFYCFCALLFTGCAQIVAPTGGPKDTKPPVALTYSPENKSTHFKTNKIFVTFNKYIQLKDVSSQLIISPPLKHTPVTMVRKGKQLEILLKDTLKDSTTYNFSFGNAVCDINEGNVLPNFRYVFSTGDYVDSLIVSGQVRDAFTLAPQKDGLVMLYSNLGDSAPYKKLPSYCGRTDANGFYHIENVRAGRYRLIALSKSQGDYFYHPYTEEIAFCSDTLSLTRSDTVDLSLFTELETKLHLLKAKALEKGKILLVFSKAADSINIKPLNLPKDTAGKPYTLIQYSATHDSANYWINCPLDSLRFIVYRNTKAIDTAVIYSFPQVYLNKKNPKPVPLKLSLNASDKQTDYDYHKPIVIRAEQPLSSFDLKKIYLVQRKDTIKFTADTTGLPFTIALHTTLVSDSSYHLFIKPGAFKSEFGKINDTVNMSFKIQEPTYFGSLQLNIKFAKHAHYIVYLLDSKSAIYRRDTVSNNRSIMYDAVEPGSYTIMAVKDDNKDGNWTTGNYLKGIQPENVFYFSQAINIRSNWDLTQDWLVP